MSAVQGCGPAGVYHLPAMVEEVLEYLKPKADGTYVDATLGGGGHAKRILESSSPNGRLVGIDRDADAMRFSKAKLADFGERFIPVPGRMGSIVDLLKQKGIERADGILADLGVSSYQIDEASRGFSFRSDGPLDMRMNASCGESAADLLRVMSEGELEHIIREYGEERFARRIARAISESDAIDTTGKLATVVERAVPPHARRGRIHPATRTFQALRIAVNDEMGELDRFLKRAPGVLAPGGRLVVISYHSLEDRKVKHAFRDLAKGDDFELPVRRAVVPSEDEVAENPRARSAKLRVIERKV